jgi:hypothetical protein
VSEVVTSLADPSANVIFGAVIDDQYEGESAHGVVLYQLQRAHGLSRGQESRDHHCHRLPLTAHMLLRQDISQLSYYSSCRRDPCDHHRHRLQPVI